MESRRTHSRLARVTCGIKLLSSFFVLYMPMLQPHDFWRAARHLIGKYGAEAGNRAGRRAIALRDEGNAAGHKIWGVLAATIAELETQRDSAAV